MEINHLIRDAAKVKEALTELSDNRLVTSKSLKIIIPARFQEKGLAYLGQDTDIIGIYAIIVEDTYYAISLVNAMVPIKPSNIERVKINGDEYIQFIFNPGDTVIKNLNLVKTDTIVYRIYDELFSKGNIPWYIGYNDLAHIFDSTIKHSGAPIGKNREITELIVSLIARNVKDKTQYYRTIVNSQSDVINNPPTFIALRDVTHAASNTLNRLAGSYMSQGIVAALNNVSEKQERIESLLTA